MTDAASAAAHARHSRQLLLRGARRRDARLLVRAARHALAAWALEQATPEQLRAVAAAHGSRDRN